ncbi:MAG: rod shape-determining protein MreD, partial [Prevotellaceae bacterium]|nr:rod shape-determining protein MreD [Prevotellaceae bacterium]
MNREQLAVVVNFVILLALQIFVCNALYLGIYFNVLIYPMFILFMPVHYSKSVVLFLSALTGFSVDLLSGDLGLHMAACTAIGYLRPYMLKRISNNDQIELPSIGRVHVEQYFTYTGILILLHHLILFALETFEFKETPFILTRTLLSACLNILLIGFVRM